VTKVGDRPAFGSFAQGELRQNLSKLADLAEQENFAGFIQQLSVLENKHNADLYMPVGLPLHATVAPLTQKVKEEVEDEARSGKRRRNQKQPRSLKLFSRLYYYPSRCEMLPTLEPAKSQFNAVFVMNYYTFLEDKNDGTGSVSSSIAPL